METVFPKSKITASTLERVLAAAGVAGGTAGAFVASYFDPVTAGFFPVCPLYSMTGLYCPGCGLTRGFHALFQGQFLTAIDYNLLIPVFAFVLGYLMLSLVSVAARGRGLSWKFFRPAAIYAFLVVMLVFGVVRNIPVYPLNLLAP